MLRPAILSYTLIVNPSPPPKLHNWDSNFCSNATISVRNSPENFYEPIRANNILKFLAPKKNRHYTNNLDKWCQKKWLTGRTNQYTENCWSEFKSLWRRASGNLKHYM